MNTLYIETKSGGEIKAWVDLVAADYIKEELFKVENGTLILTTDHIEITVPTSDIEILTIDGQRIR